MDSPPGKVLKEYCDRNIRACDEVRFAIHMAFYAGINFYRSPISSFDDRPPKPKKPTIDVRREGIDKQNMYERFFSRPPKPPELTKDW